jgi:hypothetical protein
LRNTKESYVEEQNTNEGVELLAGQGYITQALHVLTQWFAALIVQWLVFRVGRVAFNIKRL